MSTFVPLAADSDGTLSAVALGDWLLQVVTLKKPDQIEFYCSEFVKQFVLDEKTSEQRIVDPLDLFNMLLAHQDAVFNYLLEAREKGEIVSHVTSNAAEGPATVETRKSYMEAHREVEEFFTVLMSMVALRFNDDEIAGKAAGDLCAVFQSSREVPEFRLKLLQTLYNVFPPTFPYRFPIFSATLQYAADTEQFQLMLHYIKYINEWMKDWNLSAASKRQVYLILANQLKKLDMTDEAYPYLKQHVQCFQGESKQVLSNGETISAAIELVEDSISLPDVMYFDGIRELDAVNYLCETPHGRLVELVEVFMNGGPADLKKIQVKYPTLFDDHGLKSSACLEKIQLLSLVTLAGSRSEIEIKCIADTLNISEGEAEELIVRAIGQGLLDAKIDQMNKVVHVRSTMQRQFVRPQWEQLQQRLETWVDGVRSLLNALHQAKLQGHSSTDRSTSMLDLEKERLTGTQITNDY